MIESVLCQNEFSKIFSEKLEWNELG